MGDRPTVTIRLKPWLQEFLICSINDLVASKKNLIGAMITPLLDYVPDDHSFINTEGDEFITFELPDHIGGKNTRCGTVYMSEENQKTFERMLDIYFKDVFFNYVQDKIRYKNQIKISIYQFCADYRISFNSISYEMLKKSYYRRCEREKKTKKLSAKLSLMCPLLFLM